VKELLELAHRGTYYEVLGVTADSTVGQVKKSFYTLAQKFHPDHHMAKGELVGSLQKLMELVTLAYKTLSDENARAKYDKALAESQTFHLHRVRTEAQETVEDCMTKAKECLRGGNFVGSVVWLRKCVTLAPDDARYHALLGRSLATVAQYRNEALQHFDKAIEIDPWNVRVYFQYAETCEEIELHSRARGLYAKILEIDPAHAKSLERLAQMDAREREAEPASVISRMFGRKA
jgi:curved DNA-binding protein CbpA